MVVGVMGGQTNLGKPGAEAKVTISPAIADAGRGTVRYMVESPYLAGENAVEVLLPDEMDSGRGYRVLHVLPVEGRRREWGDAMMGVKRTGAHNRHGLICVYCDFDTVPWFGAHAEDQRKRHEEYLLKVVVPWVDREWPTVAREEGAEGRLLLGFSKSGFGAFSLLMRNPEVFGYAASWDAPLMMTAGDLGKYGTGVHFGTPERFEKYLPTKLVREHAEALRGKRRLVLSGSDGFEKDTVGMHALLDELGIGHVYLPDLSVKHHWETGWVEEVIAALVGEQMQKA